MRDNFVVINLVLDAVSGQCPVSFHLALALGIACVDETSRQHRAQQKTTGFTEKPLVFKIKNRKASLIGVLDWLIRFASIFLSRRSPFSFSEGVLLLKCVCFACFCSKALRLKAWFAPSYAS